MTTITYFLCFLAGLVGIAFHLFAVKIPGVKKSAQVANLKFSYGDFFADEMTAILASFFTVVIWLLILKEALAYKPSLKEFIVSVSVFVGFTGSSLLISLLGQAQDKINQVVNVKTDVADGKTTPATDK